MYIGQGFAVHVAYYFDPPTNKFERVAIKFEEKTSENEHLFRGFKVTPENQHLYVGLEEKELEDFFYKFKEEVNFI
jgi:hypothetical protein